MRRLDFLGWAFLSGVVLAPNARPFFKYLSSWSHILFLLYAIFFVLTLVAIGKPKAQAYLRKWVGNSFYPMVVLISISIIVWLMYPLADGLKAVMRGSDQDDCVIVGASHLMNLSHPYIERSYFGNPCSPGLGMLLLYVPFVLVNAYPFGAIFFIFLAAYALYEYHQDIYPASVFLTLLFFSLFVVELLVVGSDLFVLGAALVYLCLRVVQGVEREAIYELSFLACLAGLLASTRVNFLVLVPILSVFITMHWKKGAIFFFLIGSGVAVLPSAFIYLIDPSVFTPLHLIGKSGQLLQPGWKVFIVLVSFAGLLLSTVIVRQALANIPYGVFLSFLPALAAVSYGDLRLKEYNFSAWEGANYLLPIIPLAIVCLIDRTYRREAS